MDLRSTTSVPDEPFPQETRTLRLTLNDCIYSNLFDVSYVNDLGVFAEDMWLLRFDCIRNAKYRTEEGVNRLLMNM